MTDSTAIPKRRASNLIQRKITEFKRLKQNARSGDPYNTEYLAVYDATEFMLRQLWNQRRVFDFRRKVEHASVADALRAMDPAVQFDSYLKHLDRCIAHLAVFKDEVASYWSDEEHAPSPTPAMAQGSDKKVFIVFGRDNEAKYGVAHYLGQHLHLEPVLLDDQPGQSRTIIEKLEHHGHGVAYAVILLTPDDEGALKGHLDQASARARQNVLIELGYFLGSIGRAKMCILRKGKVEIPADLAGIEYKELDDGGAWKGALRDELEQAGVL